MDYIFSAVGALFIAYQSLRFVKWARVSFGTGTNYAKRYGAGSWAVVTGASDGIGKAMSFDLARRGHNVVLVARNAEKLDAVASELRAAYPKAQTRNVVIDFSKMSSTDIAAKLQSDLKGLDVSVLVNNVGISTEFMDEFLNQTVEFNSQMVKVNADGPNAVTYAVLPMLHDHIQKSNKKLRAGIVNLASVSALVPVPFLAVYGASKAYNYQFSLALGREVNHLGVDVLAVCPGVTKSNMTGIKKTSFFNVDAVPMARQTLNKLGQVNETVGHWHHDIVLIVMSLMSVKKFLKTGQAVRARALRNKQKNQ